MAKERNLKASQIIHPTRMAISGKTSGAGLFEMMEVLGKTKVVERMRKASAA
jgi:glutamyl-tRNA synthetase